MVSLKESRQEGVVHRAIVELEWETGRGQVPIALVRRRLRWRKRDLDATLLRLCERQRVGLVQAWPKPVTAAARLVCVQDEEGRLYDRIEA